jgi:dihydrofolate synthase / folylpolyglutamate synthase
VNPGDGATIEEINVALAGAVLDELGKKGVAGRDGRPLGPGLINAETRAAARLVGRMERIEVEAGASHVPVVFDGAHVPFNLAAVLRDLARFSDLAGPCVAVVALASDKDAAGFLRELKRRASAVVFTEPHAARRGRPALELAALAAALGLRSEVEPEPERAFRRGLELAGEAKSWLLVTGSLYLVGALRRAAGHGAW